MDKGIYAGGFSEGDAAIIDRGQREAEAAFKAQDDGTYSRRANWNVQPPAQEPSYVRFDDITGRELQLLKLPPVEFLVDNILPMGLVLLGAPPKSCKSYMCMQMCLAICTGDKFLGFHTKKHGCLYMDLESNRKRPQDRQDQILQGDDAPLNLHIVTRSGPMGKGFEEEIRRMISQYPDIKLVIVDVFRKVRPGAKRGMDPYDRDYEDYGAVKALADDLKITIILVTHTTKMKHPDDPFNELIGSAGTLGSVDVAMVIKKESRDAETAKLYVSGKDVEDQCYEIRFDGKRHIWEKLGTSQEVEAQRLREAYEQSNIIRTVKKLVQQGGGKWSGSTADIIEASKYFQGCCIYDDVRKVGKVIRQFTQQLHDFDAIGVSESRDTGKDRSRTLSFVSGNPFLMSDMSVMSNMSETSDMSEKENGGH